MDQLGADNVRPVYLLLCVNRSSIITALVEIELVNGTGKPLVNPGVRHFGKFGLLCFLHWSSFILGTVVSLLGACTTWVALDRSLLNTLC